MWRQWAMSKKTQTTATANKKFQKKTIALKQMCNEIFKFWVYSQALNRSIQHLTYLLMHQIFLSNNDLCLFAQFSPFSLRMWMSKVQNVQQKIKINLCEWLNSATDISDPEKAYNYLHIPLGSVFSLLFICHYPDTGSVVPTFSAYQMFHERKCIVVHFIRRNTIGNIKHWTAIPRVLSKCI